MKKLTAALPDAMLVAGAAAVSYGAGLLHPAAGFIAAGVFLIAGGLQVARKGAE